MGLKTGKIAIIFLVLFYGVSISAKSDAAWQGPTEILSGGWGSENEQFGINYGNGSQNQPTKSLYLN